MKKYQWSIKLGNELGEKESIRSQKTDEKLKGKINQYNGIERALDEMKNQQHP